MSAPIFLYYNYGLTHHIIAVNLLITLNRMNTTGGMCRLCFVSHTVKLPRMYVCVLYRVYCMYGCELLESAL